MAMAQGQGSGRRARGWTLVEALVVVAVLGVLAAVALPSYRHMVDNARLRGITELQVAALRLTMSESIKRGLPVSVTYREATSGLDWCYGLSVGTACDCRVSGQCQVDGVERVTWGHEHPGIGLVAGLSGKRFSFQPRRGTVTAGNVQFTGPHGKSLRVVVSGLGRIRICSPAGAAQVGGYPVC